MPKRRAWGAVAALLVLAVLLAACGGGGGSSQPQSQAPRQQTGSSGASGQVREIKVVLSDFSFEPQEITVKRGERVRLVLENTGTVAHDWTLPELNLVSPKVQPRQTATYEFSVDRAGNFRTVCAEPGHEALGMVGTLIVEN